MTVRTVWRHVAAEYAKALAGTLFGLCAIYLVVDYVDRARNYGGAEEWRWVLLLYGYKAVTVGYELAPGAMLLAAGIVQASLRRRGEYVASRALAIGPWHVVGPVVVVAALVCGGVVLADHPLVSIAIRRIDEINVGHFGYYGAWRLYFGEVRWFRGRRHIYHLRSGSLDEGFSDVTLYTLSEGFRLAQRVDAARMEPVGGQIWKLRDGTVRTLSGNASQVEHFAEREMTLDEDPAAFRIIKGRPEQLGLRELREQIELRRNVGLPVERWVLTLHNKLAYPLGGLPGALLGCALALRPGRRSYLTAALAEGFAAIVAYWAVLVFFKAATLAGLIAPAAAAWGPVGLLVAAAFVASRWLGR